MSEHYLRDDLVEVRESPVHGRGLFASQNIPRNTELGQCKVKRAKGSGPYVLWLDDDGEERYRVLCDLRFINHSKRANVVYYNDFSVVALKTIKAGEELFHDYGEEWC